MNNFEHERENMINDFYDSLKREKSSLVFNPWFDVDLKNDFDSSSPKKRLENLKNYLNERLSANYLLVAEALGYQGGHFSGIPMTSERIILGNKSDKDILPKHVCSKSLERTSKISVAKYGFNEPTATILWQKLIEMKCDTKDFVFWNAFPWHPYESSNDLLTNRTPTNSEIDEGEIVLKNLIKAIPFKKIIALGNKSFFLLNKMNFDIEKVRHPAKGGASKFREQIERLI